jgi:hypothetical protein
MWKRASLTDGISQKELFPWKYFINVKNVLCCINCCHSTAVAWNENSNFVHCKRFFRLISNTLVLLKFVLEKRGNTIKQEITKEKPWIWYCLNLFRGSRFISKVKCTVKKIDLKSSFINKTLVTKQIFIYVCKNNFDKQLWKGSFVHNCK